MSLAFLHKKGWHPNTLQNEERKWIAEQKAAEEKTKVEEYRKELEAERQVEELRKVQEAAGLRTNSTARLEWMYQGPAAASTAVTDDGSADVLFAAAKETEKRGGFDGDETLRRLKEAQAPGATFVAKPAHTKADAFVIKSEDPLFAMKRDEQRARQAVLNNPLEMQRIKRQLMAREDIAKKLEKALKKEKKKKDKAAKKAAKKADKKAAKKRKKHGGDEDRDRDRDGKRRRSSSRDRRRRDDSGEPRRGRDDGGERHRATDRRRDDSRERRRPHDDSSERLARRDDSRERRRSTDRHRDDSRERRDRRRDDSRERRRGDAGERRRSTDRHRDDSRDRRDRHRRRDDSRERRDRDRDRDTAPTCRDSPERKARAESPVMAPPPPRRDDDEYDSSQEGKVAQPLGLYQPGKGSIGTKARSLGPPPALLKAAEAKAAEEKAALKAAADAKKKGTRRPGTTKAMTEEERLARVAAMAADADKHKDVIARVQKSSEAARAAEDEEQRALLGKAPSFLSAIKTNALEESSVDAVIRSKAFKNQRLDSSM